MTTEEKIEAVMDEFDFEKVHDAMEAVGWSWHLKGIPSFYTIKNRAREHLEYVAENGGAISSGGFRAGKDEYDELYLEFIMEGWYSGDL